MNILIADDDQSIRETFVILLTELGHTVVAVANAQEALNHLKTNTKPHLVFTDVNMGEGMDGYQLYEEVKKIYLDLPVVIMTAFGSISKAVNSVKNGVFEYIEKPFSISAIEAILTKAAEFLFSNPFSLESVEKSHIEKVLGSAKTYDEAADILGINMSTLWRKRKAYGLGV
jgi:two-component system response regulator FlrC